VFNRRDESVAWVRAMGDAIHALEAGEPQVRDGVWRQALDRSALFGDWRSVAFRHVQRLTPAGVLERVASVSYVAAAAPEARERVLAQVAAVLAADPLTAGQAEVELPYETEVLWAERVTLEPGSIGLVASVNANRGGVPKPPVDGAHVHRLGLSNDAHHNPPPIHGGPDGAVCLYAQEAISRVRADGHQAFPGAYGENLTLLGIDWGALATGDQLAIGDAEAGLLLELVKHATPCQTIAHWFDERRIARISAKTHPEDARWYARVLREGAVAPGMDVRLERGLGGPS
jgi:MOSC domain-containing protein YiiM